MHIADDHTFSAYSNAVEALAISANNTTSLNNLALGQIARFQKAINPQGFPGGTYVTPVRVPELPQQEPLQRVRALRATTTGASAIGSKLNLGLRYDYFGPQEKSDPKYDSNFY